MSEGSFDWVTARQQCSIEKAFEKLRLEVEADVNTRQNLREKRPDWKGFEYGFVFASTVGEALSPQQLMPFPIAGKVSVFS
jgi:hypothetical protein